MLWNVDGSLYRPFLAHLGAAIYAELGFGHFRIKTSRKKPFERLGNLKRTLNLAPPPWPSRMAGGPRAVRAPLLHLVRWPKFYLARFCFAIVSAALP